MNRYNHAVSDGRQKRQRVEGNATFIRYQDALREPCQESVTSAIVAGGIDAKRVSAAGLGQERPIADNRSEEGRAKNRLWNW